MPFAAAIKFELWREKTMELHGLDSEAEVFFYEQHSYVLIIRGATWPQNPPEVASALK